jgi:oligopeptide/dipeptide ABC transporter ATP-binding protein
MAEPLLDVQGLRKEFAVATSLARRLRSFGRRGSADNRADVVAALDGVSFDVQPGEAVGIVGESGCGKSTLARCLVRLQQPTAGSIRFASNDLRQLSGARLKQFHEQVQLVFQDPVASLDPRWTVRQIIAEPLRIHGLTTRSGLNAQVTELLEIVGLRPDHRNRLPSELSGGEQQRVSIARALATKPRLLILDEPTSALDASTRVHVLALLAKLRRSLNMTYVLISHDLSVVRALCDRVLVMYLGRIVEVGATRALFELPLHPYTEALLAAVPVPDPDVLKQPVRLRGDLTRPDSVGCSLAPRCPMATADCSQRPQQLLGWSDGRLVACHRISEREIQPTPMLWQPGTAVAP